MLEEYTSAHGIQCPRPHIYYQSLKFKHQYPKKKNCQTLGCIRAGYLVNKTIFTLEIRPTLILVSEVLNAYRYVLSVG
jgi:hypothetical protein